MYMHKKHELDISYKSQIQYFFHSKYFRHKKMLTTINSKFLSSIDYASASLDYNIIIKGMFSQQMSKSINNNNIIIKQQVVLILHFSYFVIVMFLGTSLTISSLQNVNHPPFSSSTKAT